jgi:RecA-family ATPase
VTISPAGRTIVEALAMTTGRSLLGIAPPRQLRVGIINFEETRNTMDKRIVAAMKHYELKSVDIGDRLFVVAKNELLDFVIAKQGQDGFLA